MTNEEREQREEEKNQAMADWGDLAMALKNADHAITQILKHERKTLLNHRVRRITAINIREGLESGEAMVEDILTGGSLSVLGIQSP